MYIIGLIKTDAERVLINPTLCPTIKDLFDAIGNFLNEKDYKIEPPITMEFLELSLKQMALVKINIVGYKVAVLFGEREILQSNIDRSLHLD